MPNGTLICFIMRCYAFYIRITWMDDGDDNDDCRTGIYWLWIVLYWFNIKAIKSYKG